MFILYILKFAPDTSRVALPSSLPATEAYSACVITASLLAGLVLGYAEPMSVILALVILSCSA